MPRKRKKIPSVVVYDPTPQPPKKKSTRAIIEEILEILENVQ